MDPLGRRRDRTYDAAGRLVSETWVSSSGTTVNTLAYSYDAAGNQLTASDQNGAYTMTYDPLSRVTHVDEPWRPDHEA